MKNETFKGNTGKEFTTASDGTITVSKDGKTHSVKPGDPNYNITLESMNKDRPKDKPIHSSSSSNSPSSSSAPQYYKPTDGEKKVIGTAVIYNSDGSIKEKINTYIKDGAMYDQQTGQIISSNHGVDGLYNDPIDYEKTWDPSTNTGTWKPKPKPPTSSNNSNTEYTPPTKPPFVKFNEPIPTFSSDLKKVNKYTYFSGIDKVEAKRIETNKEVCFISKSIHLGKLSEKEYIEFDSNYYCGDSSSIEFYILDGEQEIPIVPISDDKVYNEKIFFNMSTRFPIDKMKPIVVKQGIRATNLSFEEASEKATDSKIENAYNITYYPKSSYKYRPFNQTIKIKAIIRTYNIEQYAPYIKSMKIRKYGGNTLWNQDL